jgi:ABC-type sugar transport system substrate-binding protein
MPATKSTSTLLAKLVGGALVVALLAAVMVAVWPESAADRARDDGERLGQAVGDLYYAETDAEVDAALADIDSAVADTREHAGDELASQVEDQADALSRAADGFVGSHTTDDAWEADIYQAELDVARDDLADNAGDFRTQGPEVREAFWQGVNDGLPEG